MTHTKPIGILVVEDEKVSMAFLSQQVKKLGYTLFTAPNGQEALSILENNKSKIDIVLMDRKMPVMDGLSAMRNIRIHPELAHLPVIMITSSDTEEEIKEGLDAGVFYYLTKPVKIPILRSVLTAAINQSQQYKNFKKEQKKHKSGFTLMERAEFKFQTIAEAESLAGFIANSFPAPESVITGIGELLVNAIEHGNLNISYTQKTELIEAGKWKEELSRLITRPEYRDKYATAILTKNPQQTTLVIKDQGNGFDWQKYLTIDPGRASDNHGRGIALTKALCFEEISYNDKGNEVTVFIRTTKSE